MRRKISSLSLRYLMNFSLLIILPVLISGILLNLFYNRYFVDQFRGGMQETVEAMALRLDNELRNVSILASALVHNPSFIEAAIRYNDAEDPAEVYRLYQDLDLQSSNLFLYTNKIGTLFGYFSDKPVYQYRNYTVPEERIRLPEREYLRSAHPESKSNLVYMDEDLFLLDDPEDDGAPEPLVVLSIDPDSGAYEGKLLTLGMAVRLSFFNEIQETHSQKNFAFLTDGEGTLILQSRTHDRARQLLAAYGKEDEKEINRWVLSEAEVSFSGWRLYYVSDKAELRQPLVRINRIFYLAMAGMLLAFIGYTLIFFHNLVSPIGKLIGKMNEVEQGDYSVEVRLSGPREIEHLLDSFNRMVARVGSLTREREAHQRERAALELEALQYQINPHFVANTLNSIRMMAAVKKDDHIMDMTAALMRMVNDSFRGEGLLISLNEEMQNIASYIHIMKVRFGNRIRLENNISREQGSFRILKMLLQPLVENAIVHGFAGKKGAGVVTISARLEAVAGKSDLVIVVEDNGTGFLQTESLPASSRGKGGQRFSSLGLRNVNRRIRLNYGEEYGLDMVSRPGEGTCVAIRLPGIPEEDE